MGFEAGDEAKVILHEQVFAELGFPLLFAFLERVFVVGDERSK